LTTTRRRVDPELGCRVDPRPPAGILDPERFGVLDDGPWRREAAGRHSIGLPRPSTTRNISWDASSPANDDVDFLDFETTDRPGPSFTDGNRDNRVELSCINQNRSSFPTKKICICQELDISGCVLL
jgi:hypothetical protein